MTSLTAKLYIEFSGYGLMRIPTDPDPTDDPRGISGYTFAFGDEPDLDRVIRLQPEWDELRDKKKYIRSHSPKMGVTVKSAVRRDPTGREVEIEALKNMPVNWEDGPKLENRNLILTAPGQEPISPFNMRIGTEFEPHIYRSTPVDPKEPVWKASDDDLARMAAYGMYDEPDTVGRATGMWDTLARVRERISLLERDKKNTPLGSPEMAVIDGRLWQLRVGFNDPTNRRVTHSTMVERFSFAMNNGKTSVTMDKKALHGIIDTSDSADWQISFWIGGWDPDTLSAYFSGTLEIPYKA